MLKYIIAYWPNPLTIKLYYIFTSGGWPCSSVIPSEKKNIQEDRGLCTAYTFWNMLNHLKDKWSRKEKVTPKPWTFNHWALPQEIPWATER